MDLGLRGRSVVSQEIEYTVAMYLTDEYFIRLDGPFTLVLHDRRIAISPETDPPEHFDPVRDLVGQVITESVVDDSGVLSISFDTGAADGAVARCEDRVRTGSPIRVVDDDGPSRNDGR